MFVDASAIVAILGREQAAGFLLEKIKNARGPIHYSSLAYFEAVVSLARQRRTAVLGEHAPTPPHLIQEMQAAVEDFFNQIGAVEMRLPDGVCDTALAAASTYGRFVGHPARLNFGDCFSYAAAKSLKVPLLFVGDDFAKTDMEIA